MGVQVDNVFFSSFLKKQSYCFLAFMICDEKSAINFIENTVYVTNCFLLLISRFYPCFGFQWLDYVVWVQTAFLLFFAAIRFGKLLVFKYIVELGREIEVDQVIMYKPFCFYQGSQFLLNEMLLRLVRAFDQFPEFLKI